MNFQLSGLIGLLLVGSLNVLFTFGAETVPQLEDEYWGPGQQPSNVDESIRPFKIVFDKQMVDDLKIRLKNTRKLQPPVENAGWEDGVSSNFIPTLVDYWLNKYDFQKREEHLNQYPQFITNIQGLDIHFIHVKPQLPNDRKVEVLPLYLQHGWPGSVVEFYRSIPLLTTVHPDRDFVFEVVVPSLPGFGYSGVPAKSGVGPAEIAHIMKNLMVRLGFTKWYTQGGDWGAIITATMAATYPEHVLGMHSNWCIVLSSKAILKAGLKEGLKSLWSSEARKNLTQSVKSSLSYLFEETGFFHLHMTKPETVGVALSDSPAGLAAYILEKFATFSRNLTQQYGDDRNLLQKFTMDELLDNVMLYWAPNKVTTTLRLYAQLTSERTSKNPAYSAPINVPSACAQFPVELVSEPEEVIRDRFVNLVSLTKMPQGGHFAAMEEPQLLTDDVWAAVKKMREKDNEKKCKKFLIFSNC